MKGRTSETGETGELLVLAELYRRGVLGGRAVRGARGVDLLTSTGPTLQVKAKRGRGRWVLGQEGRRPAADQVVLVSVGDQHADDQFFVVPVGVLYDWAEDRHRAYWATRVTRSQASGSWSRSGTTTCLCVSFWKTTGDAWKLVNEVQPLGEINSATGC